MWPDHNLTTAELFIHLYILPRGEVVMSAVRTSLTSVYKTVALLHVDCKSNDKKQSANLINGVIAFD